MLNAKIMLLMAFRALTLIPMQYKLKLHFLGEGKIENGYKDKSACKM